jgi:Adenovirus EB1 55K protein / large t-antigen
VLPAYASLPTQRVLLPAYKWVGPYAGYAPQACATVVLPCRAPTTAACAVRSGRLSLPAGVHVVLEGRISFEAVSFTRAGSMAAVLCQAGADIVFSGCVFQGCDVFASNGCTVCLRGCSFEGADVAVCATGQSTTSMNECSTKLCSEALVAEDNACIVAQESQLLQSRVNVMHAADRGSLILEHTRLDTCSHGYAAWAHGEGSSIHLQSCAIRDCARGPLWVGSCTAFMAPIKLN